MRDYESEFQKRVAWIRALVASASAKGVVFGNSGGKDSALVGILCKAACDKTVGVILPCGSKRNYGADACDARTLADAYEIETRTVDLSPAREALLAALGGEESLAEAQRVVVELYLDRAGVFEAGDKAVFARLHQRLLRRGLFRGGRGCALRCAPAVLFLQQHGGRGGAGGGQQAEGSDHFPFAHGHSSVSFDWYHYTTGKRNWQLMLHSD